MIFPSNVSMPIDITGRGGPTKTEQQISTSHDSLRVTFQNCSKLERKKQNNVACKAKDNLVLQTIRKAHGILISTLPRNFNSLSNLPQNLKSCQQRPSGSIVIRTMN